MTLDQLRWIIPLTLAVLALVQIVYLLLLRLPGRGRKRDPLTPIMPTNPQNVQVAGGGAASATTPELIGRMVVLSGLPNAGELPIPAASFGIGRFYNPEQDVLVALDERSISRRHASFTGNTSRNEYYLSDMQSSYGTVVRKEGRADTLRPGQQERIYNGDVVQFGNVVTVRFVLPGETRASATRL